MRRFLSCVVAVAVAVGIASAAPAEAKKKKPKPAASLVADIFPRSASSDPQEITSNGKALFFYADDGVHGLELWTSTGTKKKTKLVKDINPGFNNAIGNTSADDGGVFLHGGSGGGSPFHMSNMVALDGVVFFAAFGPAGGFELWKSAGKKSNTVRVRDINPGPAGSDPEDLVVSGDFVYFTATDGEHGPELWRTDGTEAGTIRLTDLSSQFDGPRDLTDSNGVLYFAALDGSDEFEMYKSDGSFAGTSVVADLNGDGSGAPYGFTAFAGKTYFGAFTDADGYELWSTDGTAEETSMVTNVDGANGAQPGQMTVFDGKLYFTGVDESFLQVLYVTEGTEESTEVVDLDMAFIDAMVVSGDDLFIDARDGDFHAHLLSSDGTPEGTDDLTPSDVTDIDRFTDANGTLFFLGSGPLGQEPYRSDGSAAGTQLVMDVDPGSLNSDPYEFTLLGSNVYFGACVGGTGCELWRTSLTPPA